MIFFFYLKISHMDIHYLGHGFGGTFSQIDLVCQSKLTVEEPKAKVWRIFLLFLIYIPFWVNREKYNFRTIQMIFWMLISGGSLLILNILNFMVKYQGKIHC